MPIPKTRQQYIQGHLATGIAAYETAMGSSWTDLTAKQKGLAKLYMRKRLRAEMRKEFFSTDETATLATLATLVTAQSLTSTYDTECTTIVAALIDDATTNGFI